MRRKNCPIPRRNLGLARVRSIRARRTGMSVKDIARSFGVHPNSVSRWISKYSQHGAPSLRSKKSSGRPRKIECEDFFPKLRNIVRQPATTFGYSSPLWNSNKIRNSIDKIHGIKISQPTMWRALRDIGLSYQKPERRAFEANDKKRKIWLKSIWPRLKRNATKKRAVILFEDESSVSLTPNSGKTWAKIGRTPIVKFTGKKGSVSVISAISPRGRLYFTVPPKTVNSAVFIKFLKQILAEIPRKQIYMVLDGGSTHTSKMTTDFVAKESRLKLIFLPGYSPDFNPDEYTWGRLKSVELTGHSQTSVAGLRAQARNSMRSIQRKPHLVRSFYKRSKLTQL